MHAVDPLVKDKFEPSMQGVHTVTPLVAEKEPAEQGLHTRSDVVVQEDCWYVPGEHIEQGEHAVAPLILEKFEPSEQGIHTLSDEVVQLALQYVPGEHGAEEQGVQTLVLFPRL